MDTSEQYIKMCDCPEIQDNRKQHMEDWGDFCHPTRKGEFIWLPRQDQLQRMVQEPMDLDFTEAEFLFHEFAKKPCRLASMEQHWLAFVMHELHKLKWNGSEWVKE